MINIMYYDDIYCIYIYIHNTLIVTCNNPLIRLLYLKMARIEVWRDLTFLWPIRLGSYYQCFPYKQWICLV